MRGSRFISTTKHESVTNSVAFIFSSISKFYLNLGDNFTWSPLRDFKTTSPTMGNLSS